MVKRVDLKPVYLSLNLNSVILSIELVNLFGILLLYLQNRDKYIIYFIGLLCELHELIWLST